MTGFIQRIRKWFSKEPANIEEKLKYAAVREQGCEITKMATNAYDFSKMMRMTQSMQTVINCSNCKQMYEKKWCKDDMCLFCRDYLPMRDTYFSILRDIDWQFMRSGESSRPVFYNAFLDNLDKWSQRFHVMPTKQDLKEAEELRKVQDWSREDWH